MRALALSLALFCQIAPARTLPEVLKGVEDRYNRIRSLTVEFEQSYTAQGRKRMETGMLTLRKPGRMRWDYRQPEGKVFLSDGEWLWFFSPFANRVEKARAKSSEDLRAPLAFLLGKLDFKRDFADLAMRESNGDSVIRALPRNDRVPYTQVEFTVTAANEIRALAVRGADGSLQEFLFKGERPNIAVSDATFRYIPPKGAEVVEVSSFGEAER